MEMCHLTKAAVSRRHNLVRDKIAKELKRGGSEVHKEKTYRIGTKRFQPDITVHTDHETLLVELTVPYEQSIEYLNKRFQDKKEYYEPLLKADSGCFPQGRKVRVVPIVIGCTGTILEDTKANLKDLKILSRAKYFQMIAMGESTRIWSTHMQRNGRSNDGCISPNQWSICILRTNGTKTTPEPNHTRS